MVFPAILGALATVGTTFMTAVSTIGPAVSSFAASVGPMLANIIRTTTPMIETISKFANTFLQILSILKPGETIESLGERAMQAAEKGMSLDDADSVNDYFEKLRSMDIDPELSEKRSPVEKLLAGIAIATVGVENKLNAEQGSLNGLGLLPLANPQSFTPERMQSLVTTCRLGNEVMGYLNKTLSAGDTRSLEKSFESCADVQPGQTKGQSPSIDKLYDALDAARDKWAEISKDMANSNQQ